MDAIGGDPLCLAAGLIAFFLLLALLEKTISMLVLPGHIGDVVQEGLQPGRLARSSWAHQEQGLPLNSCMPTWLADVNDLQAMRGISPNLLTLDLPHLRGWVIFLFHLNWRLADGQGEMVEQPCGLWGGKQHRARCCCWQRSKLTLTCHRGVCLQGPLTLRSSVPMCDRSGCANKHCSAHHVREAQHCSSGQERCQHGLHQQRRKVQTHIFHGIAEVIKRCTEGGAGGFNTITDVCDSHSMAPKTISS
mmetsp:Transcript_42087/g.90392  ORF Transcript_42087/g.90392 Transcript_42087/m.90392 type:complete len:248 (+) Transcript_42087:738-1481(+)